MYTRIVQRRKAWGQVISRPQTARNVETRINTSHNALQREFFFPGMYMKFKCFFLGLFCQFTLWKISRKVPFATNTGVAYSSTPYTMLRATASLVTISAEDLRFFLSRESKTVTEQGTFSSDKIFKFKNDLDMLIWIK